MKSYLKLMLTFCICALATVACKDSDNETGEDAGSLMASFGTPLLKTMENTTPLQIPVILSKPASRDVAVRIAVSKEEGAKEGVHYSFLSKEIVIAKGASAGYFEVNLVDDRIINDDRIFEVELLEANGAKVSEKNGVCRVVIRSDEGLPVLELGENVASVGEDEGELIIPLILSRPYTKDVSLKVHSVDSTAKEGVHFTVLNPEITIVAGDISADIRIKIVNDNDLNDDRFFIIKIADGQNAVISGIYSQCGVKIVNDDKPSYVSFGAIVGEVFESDGSFLIPVKIEGSPKNPVTVSFKKIGGTAVEGSNFDFETTSITFPVGTKEANVKLIIKDNSDVNKDRKVQIGFDALEGVTCATKDTTFALTILNDDIDYIKLYDQMMGTWTMTQTSTVNALLTCTVTISAGSTLEEQDANYLKILVCKATKYAESANDIKWRMSYNSENGEIKVICGEEVTDKTFGFGEPYGNCRPRFEIAGAAEADRYNPVLMTANKNYTKLIWDPSVTVSGILYKYPSGERANTHWFQIKDAVMTKNK